MGLNHSPRITTDGLVLALDTANTKSYPGSGSSWLDLSKKVSSSSLLNSPTASTLAFSFDGVDSYTSVPYDLSWGASNSVSIHITVRPSTLSQHAPFLGKGPSLWEWQLIQNNANLKFVYWNTSGGHTNGPIPEIVNFFTAVDAFVVLTLVWTNVDNSYYFYRNGDLVKTVAWVNASINQNRSTGFNIGGNIYSWNTGSNYWAGDISNLYVYDYALSSVEVKQLFNATRSRFGI